MPRVTTGGARVWTALDAASAQMSSKASAKGSRGDGDDMRSNQPRGGVAENRHSLAPCTWYRAIGGPATPMIVRHMGQPSSTPPRNLRRGARVQAMQHGRVCRACAEYGPEEATTQPRRLASTTPLAWALSTRRPPTTEPPAACTRPATFAAVSAHTL